jgi:hypothetical protein
MLEYPGYVWAAAIRWFAFSMRWFRKASRRHLSRGERTRNSVASAAWRATSPRVCTAAPPRVRYKCVRSPWFLAPTRRTKPRCTSELTARLAAALLTANEANDAPGWGRGLDRKHASTRHSINATWSFCLSVRSALTVSLLPRAAVRKDGDARKVPDTPRGSSSLFGLVRARIGLLTDLA